MKNSAVPGVLIAYTAIINIAIELFNQYQDEQCLNALLQTRFNEQI